MEERDVVTAFLRHEGEVLLLRRSEAVGSYSGRWGAVAGHVEGTPEASVRAEIREETGLDPEADVALAAAGEPFDVADEDLEIRWTVHPFLFDAARREVEPDRETDAWDWVPAPEIRRRETVPDLWRSYDRVRPTVATVAGDREHGSASLSLRALEVLRDEAALATEGAGTREDLAALARDLRAARPSMPVLANRVDRVMAAAGAEGGAAAVETAALAAIERSVRVDRLAGARAAERVRGARVATLSRSGTVREALDRAAPAAVLVAESRPGGEGVGVAEAAAEAGLDVTLTGDAALAYELAAWGAEALLVGADAVLPDGRVLNKVGTRGAAIAAAHGGIDVVVAAGRDKVLPAGDPLAADPALEPRDRAELYEGEAALAVENPTFDVTPPDVVDAVVTEEGTLGPEGVAEVAAAHRERAAWTGEE